MLFELFQQQVECVLLNACYSEVQAQAIHQDIDYVIGMNKEIGDEAAVKFATGFYDALFANRTLEDCYELGCASINLEGIPEYSTPVFKGRRRRNQSNDDKNEAKNYTTSGEKVTQNLSVSIGGSVTGSAIQTGDSNVANVTFTSGNLPTSESVNIHAEISALQEILAKLSSSDRRKIDNAFADIEEELDKPIPDKAEVGKALERALGYAQKAEGFATQSKKLKVHLTNTVAWLGDNWYKLLSISCS